VENPGPGVEVVREHGTRKCLGQMDVAVDESGTDAEHAAVHHTIEAFVAMPRRNLGSGTDVDDPVVVHEDAGVAHHSVVGIDEECEFKMLDERTHGRCLSRFDGDAAAQPSMTSSLSVFA
jgi:hypothetical protein